MVVEERAVTSGSKALLQGLAGPRNAQTIQRGPRVGPRGHGPGKVFGAVADRRQASAARRRSRRGPVHVTQTARHEHGAGAQTGKRSFSDRPRKSTAPRQLASLQARREGESKTSAGAVASARVSETTCLAACAVRAIAGIEAHAQLGMLDSRVGCRERQRASDRGFCTALRGARLPDEQAVGSGRRRSNCCVGGAAALAGDGGRTRRAPRAPAAEPSVSCRGTGRAKWG